VAPSVENVDVGYLMWDLGRYARHIDDLSASFVVKFHFYDALHKLLNSWLILGRDDVDLCYIDPGRDVDFYIENDLATFVTVWMGWKDLRAAMKSGYIQVRRASEIHASDHAMAGSQPACRDQETTSRKTRLQRTLW
jgi:hypothetical protein